MANHDNLTPDINFLYEMGNIRLIDRMWRRFHHTGFANLAEHHFRVFWIAMSIAAHEKGADSGKIAKMALVHDIAESRTGDVDYLARQYTKRDEDLGIADMLSGTSMEKEYLELIQEYETRTSLEAKIVKDADNLDVDFELLEQASNGSPLRDKWFAMREEVGERKLYTETAKAMYKQLRDSDPHEWHFTARNRYTKGDWKQK